MAAPLMGQRPQSAIWASKVAQRLAGHGLVPKSLRTTRPAPCRAAPGGAPLPENPTKSALKALPKGQLVRELQARGLEASGNKPVLIDRLHAVLASQPASGTAAQRGAVADRPASTSEELLALRKKVVALDEELTSLQTLLDDTNAARESERQQLEALQGEVADMQARWEADRAALDDAVSASQTVAESDEEVRELQAAVVQLSERVVKMQTLVKDKDEQVAELQRKLREARPAFALAGAAGAEAGAASFDDMLAGLGFGSGEVLPAGAPGNGGGMWEAAVSAQAAPSSHPLGDKAFRSDILQQPGVLGITLAAGGMAAADASTAVWASVRRLAPPEQRSVLDAAAIAAVGSVTAAAALVMSQQQ